MNRSKDYQVKMLKRYDEIMAIVTIILIFIWVFAIKVVVTKKKDIFLMQEQTN